MQLPSEAIAEFQALWKQTTGSDLAFDEAEKQAKTFLQVLRGALAPQNNPDPP